MSYAWVGFVLFYAIIKGIREVVKKKAMTKSSMMEVLLFYTLFSFFLVFLASLKNIRGIILPETKYYFLIFLKSFVIFIAWICAFRSILHLPISLYGVMDMARLLFSTILAIIVLGESLTLPTAIGLSLVIAGLLLVNARKGQESRKVQLLYVGLTLASGFLNAVSGTMDKVLMKDLESGQLQFWYMLFLSLLYLGYVVLTRTPIHVKNVATNYWIIILSFIFVLADRALFIANGYPNSHVIVMTLIKQCSLIVTVLLGRLIFHEKHILYRLLCGGIILAGVIISLIG